MLAPSKTPTGSSPASLQLLLPHSSVDNAEGLLRMLEGTAGADVIHKGSPNTDVTPLRADMLTNQGESRFEVLRDGLSFDLTYLGKPSLGMLRQFDAELRSRAGLTTEDCGMVAIAPGAHLSGAERHHPVLRAQFAIADDFCARITGALVLWPPSRVTVEAMAFLEPVESWGDPPCAPSRLMFPLSETLDAAMQSEGLAYFTGQEIRLEGDLAREDRAAKIGGWLSHLLAREGRLDNGARIAAPDGRYLALEPSTNGRFVRVRLV